MPTKTAAIILAAGQGKRMRSTLPKVLHPCVELPLVAHVVELALAAACAPIVVVVSPEGRRVRELLTALFPDAPLQFAVQKVPQGTGDAARAGLAMLSDFDGSVVILCGDAPLLTLPTVSRLAGAAVDKPLALLTAEVPDPAGYGRVVRDDGGQVEAIVEDRDATAAQRRLHEINAGVYCCRAPFLRESLQRLQCSNAQGEYYLTDVVAMAVAGGGAVGLVVDDADEIRGVNSRADLALAESILRRRLIARHQDCGVTFRDPGATWIGARVALGEDVTIGVGVQLWGRTQVGDRVAIEGPTVVRDCEIANDATIGAFCHLEGAEIGPSARVGPFARLREGAELDVGSRVGNFVELKKTRLGRGSKANHLAYLGDADIGPDVNVGAGTITCNYDGVNKHPTRLAEGVFVGSNATLVAPVDIGPGAYVAAGSTITQPVQGDSLAFGRARQVERAGYAVRLRQRMAEASVAAKAKGGDDPQETSRVAPNNAPKNTRNGTPERGDERSKTKTC